MKYSLSVDDKALIRIIERIISEASHNSSDMLYRVSPSSIHGVGIHAIVKIPMGTCLGSSHIRDASGRYTTTQLGAYHNHSNTPNTINISNGGTRSLHTISDVIPGDEITVDYTKQPDLEQPESFLKKI